MKPKRQEDSSCVFAYRFCRGARHRRDTAGKEKGTEVASAQITAFLTAIQGNRFETLFILTLFTGMREGEVLGLTWDCIDFHTGIISVEKQM